jgi:maltooligosyltrehalose trehalohydrolase
VTEGRRAEFRSFRAFADPQRRSTIPDPQARDTFERSRLAWDECMRPPHREILALYTRLLRLRRQWQPGRLTCADFDARALDAHTVALTMPFARVIARLSAPGTVETDTAVPIVLTTEDPDVAGDGAPMRVTDGRITFVRPGAVVMSMSLAPR